MLKSLEVIRLKRKVKDTVGTGDPNTGLVLDSNGLVFEYQLSSGHISAQTNIQLQDCSSNSGHLYTAPGLVHYLNGFIIRMSSKRIPRVHSYILF